MSQVYDNVLSNPSMNGELQDNAVTPMESDMPEGEYYSFVLPEQVRFDESIVVFQTMPDPRQLLISSSRILAASKTRCYPILV